MNNRTIEQSYNIQNITIHCTIQQWNNVTIINNELYNIVADLSNIKISRTIQTMVKMIQYQTMRK
jgi:hypothetical protein